MASAREGIDELIDRTGKLVDEEGKVPQRLFNDDAVFEAEIDRIFGRSWVFVGHETEIIEPGDYALRYIGKDPYIFARDEDGEVQVLFNSCSHRGTEICRAEQGNTSHFKCPYHDWTYNNKGELVGVPFQSEGYGNLDKDELGLISASRVEEYNGLYFASLVDEGPSLEEFLGGFTWYLDMHFNSFTDGLEVVGDPHRYEVDADWKSGADNFAGDMYHTPFLHRSVFESGLMGESDVSNPKDRYRYSRITGCENGHGTIVHVGPPDADRMPKLGYPEDVLDLDKLDDEQQQIFRRSFVHIGTVFPNFSFIHIATPTAAGRRPRGALSIRKWRPTGPGEMEIWNWMLVPKSASDEYKEEAYRSIMSSFSPSGNFEQDDFTVWPNIASTADSVTTRRTERNLHYGAGDDIDELEVDDGLDHEQWPGETTTLYATDIGTKNLYRGWHKMMNGEVS